MTKAFPVTRPPRASGFFATDICALLKRRAVAAGNDPSAIPEPANPFQIIRTHEAARILGVAISTVYKYVGANELPRPMALDVRLPTAPTEPAAA